MSARPSYHDRALTPQDDFVLAQTGGSDEQPLTLAPPDGQTIQEAAEALTGLPNSFVPGEVTTAEATPPPLQFTLWELFTALTLTSMSLAAATWLPLEAYAGVCGLLVLASLLVFVWRMKPLSRLGKIAWGTLVATYLVGTFIAIVRSITQ